MTVYLPWIGLLVGVLLLAHACRVLAADARNGVGVTMGGEMWFGQLWMLGAIACAWSTTSLLALPWWAGLITFALLFLLKSLALRIIVALFLATAMPEAPKPGGFNAFIERSKEIDNRKNDP